MGKRRAAKTKEVQPSEFSRRLDVLLDDLVRQQDRLASADSLTLNFVWQPAEHPHPNKLWQRWYGGFQWCEPGKNVASMLLPVVADEALYSCSVFLVRGDERSCEVFSENCREIEAIFNRGSRTDQPQINWLRWLFDCSWDELTWEDNEEPGDSTSWSLVAGLSNVFDRTRTLLGIAKKASPMRLRFTVKEVAEPRSIDRGAYQDCHRKAFFAARYAEWKLEKELEAKEVWDYWREYGFDSNDKGIEYTIELASYKVPDNFLTFATNLARGRTGMDENRYQKRAGRKGGSVVKADEL